MSKVNEIKEAAESDLVTFIKLIAPHRVLGKIHEDLIRWWTKDESKSHQLVLLPRDHQKSALMAYRVAWEITKNPAVTILYISSTANLAEKQVKFVKDILTNKIYRRYWPEMINEEEGKREKWTNSEISVDHPIRKKEGVRDPTVFTAGLTTSITGLHCNIAVLDDVVVQENAYTTDGREKVKEQYSLLASIESADAQEWVVGTRYHPDDLYQSMIDMKIEIKDSNGELIDEESVYELFQKEVEDHGDGTGEYLWPRQCRIDGKWFGFNQEILAKKKAQYLDKTQFRSQYYNDPNDSENEAISRNYFQYYDKKYLEASHGKWYISGRALNVFAAIDFAFSTRVKADYTAIVVIGLDSTGCIYLLDVDRIKTNKIQDYFNLIMKAHVKWGFRKIRAEVTIAQEAIVEELKNKAREMGTAFSVDKYRPLAKEGAKEERMLAVLKPRYENLSIFHYRSGLVDDLEVELVQQNPRNDDMKDALANAISISVPPVGQGRIERNRNRITYNNRFGGVAYSGAFAKTG